MASSESFIKFVYDQVLPIAMPVSYRKMFGDYMLYVDGRPVFLICDDTVHVKQIPETMAVFASHGITPDVAVPYRGARPHYVLDIENSDLAIDMARELARILPLPKPKKKKSPAGL